jgi:hypothetical protein
VPPSERARSLLAPRLSLASFLARLSLGPALTWWRCSACSGAWLGVPAAAPCRVARCSASIAARCSWGRGRCRISSTHCGRAAASLHPIRVAIARGGSARLEGDRPAAAAQALDDRRAAPRLVLARAPVMG